MLKNFLKLFIRKPKFVYLGEKPKENSVILSNHAGASGPLSWEIYYEQPFRMWGTYEMNSGLKSVYKYLSEVYYYQKKHWKKFWAKAFSLIACPFANLFYKGLRLIPTYRDSRFRSSLKESVAVIKEGQKIIIYPEDSSKGYFDNLTSYFAGFFLLGKLCFKQNIDLSFFVAYYIKEKHTIIIDHPIKYSEIKKYENSRDEIAKIMCDRANNLRAEYFEKFDK